MRTKRSQLQLRAQSFVTPESERQSSRKPQAPPVVRAGGPVRPGLLAPTLGPGAGPAWQIRCAELARLPDGRVDARTHCANVLGHIRRVRRDHPNHPCAVVFDLDNTLFDTRARTLHALQEFDADHGTSHFAGLGVDDMGWNGRETCGRLGLDEALTARVQASWDRTFWAGENFGEDLVIMPLFELAWAAKEAGAEVRYLTGRVEDLAAASLEQLEQAGLPDAKAENLFCKPTVDTRTGPFKAEQLEQWMDAGTLVGWFATDNRREVEDVIAHGEQAGHAFPVVHVEHALQRPGTISNDVPAYPEADLSRRATPHEARATRAADAR